MAAPNIVNVTTITGKSAAVTPSTASATSLLSNPAGSGKVLKINVIIATNVNGSSATSATVSLYSAAALGGTASRIASTISVPANAAIVILDKPIYLEEDRSIGVTALTANDLTVLCSYEEIS